MIEVPPTDPTRFSARGSEGISSTVTGHITSTKQEQTGQGKARQLIEQG
jgi:hypothetical protein